jgi:hypothetical protein
MIFPSGLLFIATPCDFVDCLLFDACSAMIFKIASTMLQAWKEVVAFLHRDQQQATKGYRLKVCHDLQRRV